MDQVGAGTAPSGRGWQPATLHPGAVLISQPRGDRPGASFLRSLPLLPPEQSPCRFCPTHLDQEALVALAGPNPSSAPGLQWSAAALRNISPMVAPPGRHEVIITSARHDTHLLDQATDLTVSSVALRLWTDRMAAAAGHGLHPVGFSNAGLLAGATQPHPHVQMLAGERPGNYQQWEAAALRTGCCLLCDPDPALQVSAVAGVRAMAVAAPRSGYELLLAPVWHTGNVTLAADQTVQDLAALLAEVGGRMSAVLGPFAYNLVLHSGGPGFHWHLHVLPRLGIPSGIELIDTPVVQIDGVRAASELRAAEPGR